MPLPSQVCDLSAALLRLGGDTALLREIAGLFREDAPVFLDRLKAALAAGDAAGVRNAAHSLKGLASNFNGEAAVLAALRLEEMGERGQLTAAAEAVQGLEDEVARLMATLTPELARLK